MTLSAGDRDFIREAIRALELPAACSLSSRSSNGERHVAGSRWRVFPARATVDAAADAIRARPSITYCDDPGCERCNDAVLGGPVVPD